MQEGAVHFSINHSLTNENINFDYMYFQDFDYFLIEKLNNEKTIKNKIVGKHYSYPELLIPEKYTNMYNNIYIHSMRSARKNTFITNVEASSISDMSSSVFALIQMILKSKPKKIYLVGCDASDMGSVLDGIAIRGYASLIGVWKEFAQFAKANYSDIEIISINPIGLKGIFTDIYTNKYFKQNTIKRFLKSKRAINELIDEIPDLISALIIAENLIADKLYNDAREILLKIIESGQHLYESYFMLANIDEKENKLDSALKNIKLAMRERETLEVLGKYLFLIYKMANPLWQNILNSKNIPYLKSYFSYLLMRYARMLFDEKKYDESFATFYNIMQLTPDDQRTRARFAYSLRASKKIVKALEVLDAGLKLDPHWAAGYVHKALCYAQKKNIKKTYDNFIKGIELEPNADLYKYLLIDSLTQFGDKFLAKKYLSKILEIYPEWVDGSFYMANNLLGKDDCLYEKFFLNSANLIPLSLSFDKRFERIIKNYLAWLDKHDKSQKAILFNQIHELNPNF